MYPCFDELDDAIVIFNQDNTVAQLNLSFQNLFGIRSEAVRNIKADTLVTRHLTQFFKDDESARRVLDAIERREEVLCEIIQMRTARGDLRWFSNSLRVKIGRAHV